LSIHTDDAVTPFIEESRRFKMLSAEEELDLGRRWRDHGDRAAMRQLVGSHLRLVIKMARDFAGYGLPVADLIAEGNVGLMQAVEKYDPERGFRFNTYALCGFAPPCRVMCCITGHSSSWAPPPPKRSCSSTCAA